MQRKQKITPVSLPNGPQLTLADLERVVQANINATSNEVRKKAEAELRNMKEQQTSNYFKCLCQLMAESQDPGVRTFVAVLLRQSLGVTDQTYDLASKDVQIGVRRTLLDRVLNESHRDTLVQVSHALGQCAAHVLVNKGQWNDLLPSLTKLSKSENAYHREAFLITLDRLAEFAVDILRPNMPQIQQMLVTALKDQSGEVRTAGLRASVSLLLSVDQKDELKYFSDMIPLLFQNINESAGDKIICKACESLHGLVENVGAFFQPFMKPIIACLGKVVQSQRLSWETKRVAMSLLVSLLEVNIVSDNEEEIASKVIPLAFGFLQCYDASLPWTEPNDDLEQTNFLHGTAMLPQLVDVFGAEIFLGISQGVITNGLKSKNGLERMASLTAVTHILDCVAHLWEDNLNNIVNAAGSSLGHDNPRVQYAALQLLQQLSVTYAEQDFQDKYHTPVMGALLNIVEKGKNVHRCVLIQACDTLAHFAYSCEQELFSKYAERCLKGLFNLLNSNDVLIQDIAFKAVSVAINALEERFQPFYAYTMKLCVDILGKTAGKLELTRLRGRAIECMEQMFANVPLEVCKADAHQALQNLIPLQSKERELGGTSYNHMVQLFASLATVLKSEFAQYLKHVIPPLLHAASLNPTTLEDTHETEPSASCENGVVSTSIHVHGLGSKKLSVNTSEFEEKQAAYTHLVTYAGCMGPEFLDFVKPVANVMIPAMGDKLHSSMRRIGAEAIPLLVNCLHEGLNKQGMPKGQIANEIQSFLNEALAKFLECMEMDEEVEPLSNMYEYLVQIMDVIEEAGGDPCLYMAQEAVVELVQSISNAIKEKQFRRLNREESFDSEDSEYANDIEAQLADNIADVVSKMAKLFGPNFVKVFDDNCFGAVTELFDKNSEESEYTLGLTIFGEIIRYGQEPALKYCSNLLNLCKPVLSDPNSTAGLRQAAAYSVGICAERGALSNPGQWLHVLKQMVDSPQSRNEDNVLATENAISAIGKIAKYQSDKIEWEKVIVGWLQMLPLLNDVDEREFCNEYVLQLMQSSFDNLVKSHESVPLKLVEVMAVALTNNDKQKEDFRKAFHFVSQKLGQKVGECISKLPPDLKEAF